MKKFVRLSLLLISGISSGALAAAPSSSKKASDPLAGVACTKFQWASDEKVGERAAMIVPVLLNGVPFRFQLDTGADATILYGQQASRHGWVDRDANTLKPQTFSAGGMENHSSTLYLRTDDDRDGGTLGLDFLVGKVAIIDYPGQRFCVLNPVDFFPSALFNRVQWAPADLRNGKFYVDAGVEGQRPLSLFFDSGSSAQPVTVDLDTWKWLTGLSSPDQATKRFVGSSWGKTKTWLGAQSKARMSIGLFSLDRPIVYYESDDPAFFANHFPRTDGLFGNVGMWSEIVVIYLQSQPSFGILR